MHVCDRRAGFRVRAALTAALLLLAGGGGAGCGKRSRGPVPGANASIKVVLPVEGQGGHGVQVVAIGRDPTKGVYVSGLDPGGSRSWTTMIDGDRLHVSDFGHAGPTFVMASGGRIYLAPDGPPPTLVALDAATGAVIYRVENVFAGRPFVHLVGERAGDLIAVAWGTTAGNEAVRLSHDGGRVVWRSQLALGGGTTWTRIVDDQLIVGMSLATEVLELDSGEHVALAGDEVFVEGHRILTAAPLSEYDRSQRRLVPLQVDGADMGGSAGRLLALRRGSLITAVTPDHHALGTRIVATPYREGGPAYDVAFPDGLGVSYEWGWRGYDTAWRVAGDDANRFMLLELSRLDEPGRIESMRSKLAVVDLEDGQVRWASASFRTHGGPLKRDSIFYKDGYYVAQVRLPGDEATRPALLVLDARTGLFSGAVALTSASAHLGYPGTPSPWSVRAGVLYDHSDDTTWALDLGSLSLTRPHQWLRAQQVAEQLAPSLGALPLE